MNEASNKSIILLNAFFALFESLVGILDAIAVETLKLNFSLLVVKFFIMALSTLGSLLLRDLYSYIKKKYVAKKSNIGQNH